jgi:hypothetical protein
MEFIIAGIGVVLAVWMIVDARGRHRRAPPDAGQQKPPPNGPGA